MMEQKIDTQAPVQSIKASNPRKTKRVAKPIAIPREAYDVQEFVYAMGWSEGLFYKILKAGKITSYKVGDKRFVTRAELERIQREGI